MEVILKRDYIGLGNKYDVVSVANGYGRNFLIPRDIAMFANEAAKKMAIENKKQASRKIAKRRDEAQSVAKTLNSLNIKVKGKLDAKGRVLANAIVPQILSTIKQETKATIVWNKTELRLDKRNIRFVAIPNSPQNGTAIVKLFEEIAAEIPVEVISD